MFVSTESSELPCKCDVSATVSEVVSVPTGLMMTRVCVVWIEKCCVSEYAIASSPALAEVLYRR